MPERPTARTSATLLGRLRDPTDSAAWSAFVERYGRMIYAWGRKRGLQDADAEDVTQEVLTVLSRALRSFQYDPAQGKFRNYLEVVTRRAVGQLVTRQQRHGRSGDSRLQEMLESTEARDDLAARLQQEFDHELLEIATRRVEERVGARTMEAFRLTALDGLSGEEVAARLGMKVTAVYMARSRVQKLIGAEIQDLEGAG